MATVTAIIDGTGSMGEVSRYKVIIFRRFPFAVLKVKPKFSLASES